MNSEASSTAPTASALEHPEPSAERGPQVTKWILALAVICSCGIGAAGIQLYFYFHTGHLIGAVLLSLALFPLLAFYFMPRIRSNHPLQIGLIVAAVFSMSEVGLFWSGRDSISAQAATAIAQQTNPRPTQEELVEHMAIIDDILKMLDD